MSSLSGALEIADSGLRSVQSQLALISQNVANAGTAGYATESEAQSAVGAAGQPMGVHAQPAIAASDPALQAQLLAQTSSVAALSTQQSALQPLDQLAGTVGSANDLASDLGALQNSFTSLLSDPSNQAQQQAVVQSAQTLTGQLNALGQATSTARQTAQGAIVSSVAALNQALARIGQLNTQIVALTAQGQSTADLANARTNALASIAQLVSVQTSTQPNGALVVATNGGVILPTDGSQGITTTNATLTPGSAAAPPILLGGVDITTSVSGGALGANIALRDTILPTRQAELDEFSATLAQRFSAQGLTLFTDATGAVPSAGTPVQANYLGLANEIEVNQAVIATPSLVRDGTQATTSFTPNPSGGPAGFSTLIANIVQYGLGSDAQAGVAQPAANSTGLGANGDLSASYSGNGSLATLAASMTASQAASVGTVSSALANAQSVQTGLQSQLQSAIGVSVDGQLANMIALQNSYGANAKIITAVEAMFTALMAAVGAA